ncbi:MAG: mechanosensitive ion channel family protein [Eubacterium sp.]|nr:mechanosensitive ion channel family protein [Eubacterium sp.]
MLGFLVAEDAIEQIDKNISRVTALSDDLIDKAINFGINLLIAAIIFFVGKLVLKAVRKLINNIFSKSSVDVGVVKFVDSIVKALGYIIIIIVICGQIGIQTTSLITLLGTAGVSIGLALQGSLSNFAGGILILVGKPFVVGNYIKAEDVEGVVTKIDILYTTLHTVDNKMVKMPNGTLSNSVVTNYTFEGKRRSDLDVGIHYDDDIKKAVEIATHVMNECPYVLPEETNAVVVKELAESAVILQIRMWSTTENYWPARFYLNEKIKEAYEHNEIHIPFNQLDVHVVKA